MSGIFSGSSSFGRAIAFQAIGGGFEPRLPLKRFGFDPDSYRDRLPLKRFGTALKLANWSYKGSPRVLGIMYKELKSRCSSVVEHFLGKEEVVSSILINGSKKFECWKEHLENSGRLWESGEFNPDNYRDQRHECRENERGRDFSRTLINFEMNLELTIIN